MMTSPTQFKVADPDSIPDNLPVTKRMHELIVTEDAYNPASRTMRAVLAAIQELEQAIVHNQENH